MDRALLSLLLVMSSWGHLAACGSEDQGEPSTELTTGESAVGDASTEGGEVSEAAPDATEAAPDTPEPAPDTPEPAPDTAEPEPDATEPAPDTTEPAPDTTEPAPDTAEPEPDATEPEPDTTEPEPDTAEPEPDTTEPDEDIAEPEPDLAEPDEEIAEPTEDIAEVEVAEPDEDISEVDVAEPEEDIAEVEVATDTSAEDAEEIAEVGPECAPCVPSEASATWTIDPEALIAAPERTRDNPLKGFLTSYLWATPANDFPDQMEFLYLPMRDVWGADGPTFDTGLEPLLTAAETRGHHVVLRIYIDYPAKPSGLPDFLSEVVSCQPYTDFGGGCSPDYDSPALVEAMVGLLSALGDAYDGDVRLGALQIGLLGFWGEWHTWPHTDWFPSNATQEAVLGAAHDAFSTTQLQVRRAAANALDLRIGFHDDSFAYSTLGDIDWFFLPGLIAAGGGERYQEVMIGGELRPELQGQVFEDGYTLGTYAQDVLTCIEATHASYLLNYIAFSGDGVGYQGLERERAEAAALAMGYHFELSSAALELSALGEETVSAEVTLTLLQSGVAPFYYPLFVSLHDDEGALLATSDEDLKTLLPGESRTLSLPLGDVAPSVVQAPMMVTLSSPILQQGQRVRLGTETAETLEGGDTALVWSPSCEHQGEVLALGEAPQLADEGCACRCDVDGLMRTCAGELCL